MALQTSGAISLNEIHVEAGGSSGSQATINDSDIRGLISKGSGAQMSFSEWYGAANVFSFSITSNTSNANLNTLATNAGWNGSAPIECTINSGVYCYATSTGGYGLTVNVANSTIINNGKIIGKGGNGGRGSHNSSGGGGGAALRITVSGVTIQNNSGAFIAGGGGGGGGRAYDGTYGAGGGGAGGGTGGAIISSYGRGSGGGVGSSGGNAAETVSGCGGHGGGAGGGGGSRRSNPNGSGGGGGGGRILPGSGGARGTPSGAPGGSAGNAGGGYPSYYAGGGGGGWGASGGRGGNGPGYGGGGGKAISKTTGYTLSNSGTIYGGT